MEIKKPFDFINAINNKYDLSEKKGFSPFLTNMFFSFFRDTVLLANVANKFTIQPEVHYDFWFNSVPKKKRFYKNWPKKVSEDEHINIIAEKYQINKGRAKEALKFMSNEELQNLEEWWEINK